MKFRALLLLAATLLSGCGNSGGGGRRAAPSGPSEPAGPPEPARPFGLTERLAVEGLTFPVAKPQQAPLRSVRAFPRLTFNRPVFLTAPADGTGRIFVVEQDGRILVFPIDESVESAALFLDIRAAIGRHGSAEGLLGLAFDPDHARNGFFYVFYTLSDPRRGRVSRFRSGGTPDAADPSSEVVLLEYERTLRGHNGGMLAFGPDGMLYLSTGDGGGANDPQNNAQNLGSLLGKVLRLDPSGAVPADNPFAGRAGARREIWALGLRNPWRFSFDRVNGALWLADVGQDEIEEIDIIEKGGNYGWKLFEGDRSATNPDGVPPAAFTPPLYTYTHAEGRSITGGYVYRGSRLPSLYGAYVHGDYATGRIWALVHDGNKVVSSTEIASVPSPSSFGEDEEGELYVCSLDGGLYRFVEGAGSQDTAFPARLSQTGLFADTARLVPAPGLIEFDVNSPLWSDGARKRRWLALPGLESIAFHPTEAWSFPAGTIIVKHFELDLDLSRGSEPARRLETRVLVLHDSGWQGYTYKWNEEQDDALLLSGGATETFTVRDPGAPGGRREQTWYFPSRADCLSCHTSPSGRILGVRTRQLNRDFFYPVATDNQLRSWNHIGLFDTDIGSAGAYESLPAPSDSRSPLARRARSYLAANCANCHLPGGPTAGDLDLRFDLPLADLNAVNVPPESGDLGLTQPLLLAPGRKESSVLWERLRRLDPMRMPPLASRRVDESAVALIGEWIDSGPE